MNAQSWAEVAVMVAIAVLALVWIKRSRRFEDRQ